MSRPEVLERAGGQVVEASCSVGGGGHHPHTLLLQADGTVQIFVMVEKTVNRYVFFLQSQGTNFGMNAIKTLIVV